MAYLNMVHKWFSTALIVTVTLLVLGVGIFVLFGFHERAKFPLIEINALQTDINQPKERLIEDPLPRTIEKANSLIDTSEIEARSIMAFNPTTHQIYISNRSELQLPIASLTKLLTAQIALDTWDLDHVLTAGNNDIEWLEWVVGLEEGDQITVENALRAMLVSSYNDAAVVVADNYPGGYDSFIQEMNHRAEILGMADTMFANPAGLHDEGHYSTALDLSKLVKYVLADGRILEFTNKYQDRIDIIRDGEVINVDLVSTNQLLGSDPYIRGLKTGFTKESGPSFIGYYDAGEFDKLVTIVLDAEEDRFEATKQLVDLLRVSYE